MPGNDTIVPHIPVQENPAGAMRVFITSYSLLNELVITLSIAYHAVFHKSLNFELLRNSCELMLRYLIGFVLLKLSGHEEKK